MWKVLFAGVKYSIDPSLSSHKYINVDQCKEKISELLWTQGSGLRSVRLHHFPIIRSPLCPHFLSHSWPAKSPMTLCCYAAVLFWENLGQLGWDAVSWVLVAVVLCEKSTSMYSLVYRCPALSVWRGRPAWWLIYKIWCRLEEVQQCQRGWVSSEHTEHIPEGKSPVILAGCHRD